MRSFYNQIVHKKYTGELPVRPTSFTQTEENTFTL